MNLNWSNLPRPIIALSPMADMTDSAFCRTVKYVMSKYEKKISKDENQMFSNFDIRISNFVMFREMVSAEAVVRGNNKTLDMTAIHPDERPLVQQIFGSDPDVMAEATRIIDKEHDPEGFDINMGCPVYKLVCNFNGASLMKEPERAAAIVKAMKAATSKPVSVKIRLGWGDPTECFVFAKALEDAGADLLTVHGRTRMQGYSGESDWEMIRKLKETVSIPVLANGDIFTAPLAIQALEQTTCDGILIARGSLGNPWIFRQIEEMLAGETPKAISIEERIDTIRFHLTLHIEQYGEKSVTTFRKHLTWYLKGLDGAKKYKERLHTAPSREEVEKILDEMRLDPDMKDAIAHRDAAHPDAGERMKLTK
ncbi:MAG: tRNA dihydrouridine synthase DusB [Candidatus Uhrbacteria bacterium]|nr:tRNA dihydrouridine synthase DusB [Candidatus Uhrbacteria bacterium]